LFGAREVRKRSADKYDGSGEKHHFSDGCKTSEENHRKLPENLKEGRYQASSNLQRGIKTFDN
jgi:hypothetical protein